MTESYVTLLGLLLGQWGRTKDCQLISRGFKGCWGVRPSKKTKRRERRKKKRERDQPVTFNFSIAIYTCHHSQTSSPFIWKWYIAVLEEQNIFCIVVKFPWLDGDFYKVVPEPSHILHPLLLKNLQPSIRPW